MIADRLRVVGQKIPPSSWVVICGNRISNCTTRIYDDLGELQLSKDHGYSAHHITCNADGNFAVSNEGGSYSYLRWYYANGSQRWSHRQWANYYGIAMDVNGNVAAASARLWEEGSWGERIIDLRYFTAAGSNSWVYNHGGGSCYSAAIRPSNRYPIFGHQDRMVEFTTAGSYVRATTAIKSSLAIKVHTDGTVVAAYGNYIYKRTPTFGSDWSYNHGATVRSVDIDSDGNIYLAGTSSGSVTHRKLDEDGNVLKNWDHGATVNGIAVDEYGNVFIGGVASDGVTIRRYGPDGSLIWNAHHGATVNDVAVYPNPNL